MALHPNKSGLVGITLLAAAAALVLLGRSTGRHGSSPTETPPPPATIAALSQPSVVSAPVTNAVRQVPTARGTLPYVLTGKTPFDKPLRLVAESFGAKTISSVSRKALLVEADEATRTRLEADSRFEEVSEWTPTEKVQPALAALIKGGAKSVEVSILALEPADRASVIAALEKGGGEMLTGCINEGATIRAKLPADCVAELALRGEVRWMEVFRRPRLLNDKAVEAPQMNVREVWDTHGLTGAGQGVSTSDTGIDTGNLTTMHRDLRNNVKDIQIVSGCYTNDVSGHGTHTAGSIVGDGTMTNGVVKGTAYKANLYAWFCNGTNGYIWTPSELGELFQHGGAWTASVHSASWGSSTSGQYDSECVNYDKYVWNHPEFLPVFAAGNEGCDSSGNVKKNTIGSPAAAKNVLAVGATQNGRSGHDGGWGNGNSSTIARFSSRGPCADGRTKPDVSAPGIGILSTRAAGISYSYGTEGDYYAYDSGTSMATPLTAGAVALIRQWLVEKKGFPDEDGKRPTSALMKAVIMGGAKGVTTPSNDFGWGRVDLEETLFPSNRAVKLLDRLPFASGWSTNIVIETTNAAPLDVQLVWIDYPGSASATQSEPKLVNDLDLTVSPPDSSDLGLQYGNGGTSADRVNNAESVRISSAAAGKYVITVTCPTIQYDSTEGGAAALYIRGAFDPSKESQVVSSVHLVKLDEDFETLDGALAAVQEDGETVQVILPTTLSASVNLSRSCTIVATRGDPSTAMISCGEGAVLTVTNNAVLTLTNVVFSAATKSAMSVAAGAKLKVAGTIGFGAVTTADAAGLDVCGPFVPAGDGVLVCCEVASAAGDAFGTFSCDYATATNCAGQIYNADNTDLYGVATNIEEKCVLVWAEKPDDGQCDPEDANVIVVDASGNNLYYSNLNRAFTYVKGDAAFYLRSNDVLSNSVDIAASVCLTTHPQKDRRARVYRTNDAQYKVGSNGVLRVLNIYLLGASSDSSNSKKPQYNYDSSNDLVVVDGGTFVLGSQSVFLSEKGNAIRLLSDAHIIISQAQTYQICVNDARPSMTNAFATFASGWTSAVASVTNTAAHFVRSPDSVASAAVSNAVGTASLVWSDYLASSGSYVDSTGGVYRAIGVDPGKAAQPAKPTFEGTTCQDGKLSLSVTAQEADCWYAIYETASLLDPFKFVKSVLVKAGETFTYEIDPTEASQFLKIVAE